MDGRIHNCKFKVSAGGVARNICEGLTKLGCKTTFISAVGDDDHGNYLSSLLPKICTNNVQRITQYSTAQCTIIFNKQGDCLLLVGDMDIHRHITPDVILEKENVIKMSPLLVLDGNLSAPTLETALQLADKYQIPVLYEPTDVPVSVKPFKTCYWKSIKYITPNINELKEIASFLNILPQIKHHENSLDEVANITKEVAKHISTVVVTLGSDGILIASKLRATDPFIAQMISNANESVQVRHYSTKKVENVVNVSGAGDCLVSGLIAASLKGFSEEQCVAVGFAAAMASLTAHSAVPTNLSDAVCKCWSSTASYNVII